MRNAHLLHRGLIGDEIPECNAVVERAHLD